MVAGWRCGEGHGDDYCSSLTIQRVWTNREKLTRRENGYYGALPMIDDWKSEFRNVWDRGVAAWKAGRRSSRTMFEPADVAFLTSIGCTAQELFDFVDDALEYGDFGFDTVLAVTDIRRRYFIEVMGGKSTGRIVPMHELPAKSAKVDGIAWLPRLIAKARIKLRGEMDPDLMYGCAGDRPFLRDHRMTLPQFLQLVWDEGDDDRAIVDAVKRAGAAGSSRAFAR